MMLITEDLLAQASRAGQMRGRRQADQATSAQQVMNGLATMSQRYALGSVAKRVRGTTTT